VSARRAALACLSALSTCLLACGAPHTTAAIAIAAPEVDPLTASFEDGVLHVGGALTHLPEPAALEKTLGDGVPHVVELRVEAIDEATLGVLATWRQRCVVRHDAWTDTYEIDHRVSSDETLAFGAAFSDDGRDFEGVLDACLRLDEVVIAPADAYAGAEGPVHAVVVARLDPPTSDDIHRLRHWLANPDASGAIVPSVFGLIAQLFVNRSGFRPAEEATRVSPGAEIVP
jgi:hypothetical protein